MSDQRLTGPRRRPHHGPPARTAPRSGAPALLALGFERLEFWPLWLGLLLLGLWLLGPAPRFESLGPRLAERLRGPRWPRHLARLALLCLCLALLGPQGAPRPLLAPAGRELLLVLDVSRSMLARDTLPSRLGRAQAELSRLVERFAGDRLGLVLFAGQTRLAVPLTLDGEALARAIAQAGPASLERGGSDIAAALRVSGELLWGGAPSPGTARALLLCTDGECEPPVPDFQREWPQDRPVFVLGLGSPRGARIPLPLEGGGEAPLLDAGGRPVESRADWDPWRRLAEHSGGAFFATDSALGSLAEPLAAALRPGLAESDGRQAPAPLWRWPLLLAMALAFLATAAWRAS
jgi:Ca-activated chloride channel family protein